MTIQQANAELVDNLSAYFPRRNEPNVAWGNAGVFMHLPGLRGYWPMSSVDENGAVYDLSGQGRTLTNNSSAQFGVYNGLAPYVIGDGVADYLSRADEAGTSITGAMTAYAWAWSEDGSTGTRGVIGKSNPAGNQRSWLIHTETFATFWVATISPDGTAPTLISVVSTVPVTPDAWTFLALVYVPSTSLTLYVSDGKKMVATANVTSIPAAIFNSTAALTIAAQDAGTFFAGRVAQSALCAVAHDNLTVQTTFHETRALYGYN